MLIILIQIRMKSILKRINLFLFLLFLLTGKSCAQYCHAIVRISHSPVDITDISRLISSQTGLQYSLNMQNASLKKQIILRVGAWQLIDILKQVQQQAGLNYKIIGDHILFVDYPMGGKKSEVRQIDVVSKKNRTDSLVVVVNRKGHSQVVSRADPIHKVFLPPVQSRTAGALVKVENQIGKRLISAKDKSKKTAIKKHSINLAVAGPAISSGSATRSGSASGKKPLFGIASMTPIFSLPEQPIWTKATNLNDTSLLPLSKKISLKKSNIIQSGDNTFRIRDISQMNNESWHTIFVKAGLSADEILFMNASLMAGIKYVYGIFSYGTTFNGNRLRFGLGIPIKLNNEQQLSFNATTGLRVKSSFIDSFPVSSAVKENLYRYGVAWSKTYRQRWTLQVQVHYNMLKKTSDSTNPISGYNHFYYANPPYVLSHSSGSHSEKRTWIGAQITLYYKLF